MEVDPKDIETLYKEKPDAGEYDVARLKDGEPLAYVIGHIPFLGLSLDLSSYPLIPRPETEWWTEMLCTYIGERTVHVLDLCAGSGAIGLSILKHCPNATVSFGERIEDHVALIQKNILRNGLDASRAAVYAGDLFAPFEGSRFDIIACNPPYIPEARTLDRSVVSFEPKEALFSGEDGLETIRRVTEDTGRFLTPQGELWMECDIENIEEAGRLAKEGGAARFEIRTDQYERPRILVAYW